MNLSDASTMPGFFTFHTYLDGDTVHGPLDFVVDPHKLFKPEWGDFELDGETWKTTLSTEGLLRVRVRCDYKSVGGLQGSMAMAIPPSLVDEMDMWEASRPAGVWDCHEFLAFLQLPDPEDFVVHLFVSPASFYDEIAYETVLQAGFTPDFSDEVEALEDGRDPAGLIEFECSKVFEEVFVPHLGAAPLRGQKWATCPCESCTSEDPTSICQSPGL